jgi:hypothetical protein
MHPKEEDVISHALAHRNLHLQELLVEADRERLIDRNCSPSPVGVDNLLHRFEKLLHRTLREARSPRTVLRLSSQS